MSKKKPTEDEAWGAELADVEEKSGGFPGVSGSLVRRTRGGVLARLPSEFKDWTSLVQAIRPEVPRSFVNQLEIAVRTDNPGAAMQAAWHAVVDDLRRKVIVFGLDRFGALDGMPVLSEPEDLEREVTDHNLIRGCFSLGILDSEAYVQLSHGRSLIAGYLASGRFEVEPDRLEMLNFVKNCAKYVLSVGSPARGVDIQRVMDLVEKEDVTDRVEELSMGVEGVTTAAATLTRLLFRRYVKGRTEARVDANILQLFPAVWPHSDEGTRRSIGEEFMNVRLEGTNDEASRAFSLIRLVGGASYLPEALLGRYLRQASRKLLDAHNSGGNFAGEPRPARELAELGSVVPAPVRDEYVRAIIVCYLGNPYGVSHAAERHLEGMIDAFDADLARTLMNLLRSDADVQSTLLSEAPAARLALLLGRVESRLSNADDKQLAKKLKDMKPAQVLNHFRSAVVEADDE